MQLWPDGLGSDVTLMFNLISDRSVIWDEDVFMAEHQRNKHLLFIVRTFLQKVNLSSWVENLTPTFPESSAFSTPVLLEMRGGEDEIWLPEDIWWLSSLLLSPFSFYLPFLSSSSSSEPCFFASLAFVLQLADLKLLCFPAASFNKAAMMQTCFGWGHVCFLGLIMAEPLSSSILHPPPPPSSSSPSTLTWSPLADANEEAETGGFSSQRSCSEANFYIRRLQGGINAQTRSCGSELIGLAAAKSSAFTLRDSPNRAKHRKPPHNCAWTRLTLQISPLSSFGCGSVGRGAISCICSSFHWLVQCHSIWMQSEPMRFPLDHFYFKKIPDYSAL